MFTVFNQKFSLLAFQSKNLKSIEQVLIWHVLNISLVFFIIDQIFNVLQLVTQDVQYFIPSTKSGYLSL